MRLYVNLLGVEGVGQTTGKRYLGLGTVSLEIVQPAAPINVLLTFRDHAGGGEGLPPVHPIQPTDPMRVQLTLDFNQDTWRLIAASAVADPALPGD